MPHVTLYGEDAIRVADAANMLPSVRGLDGRAGWRPAAIYNAKAPALKNPLDVRLAADGRVIIEKILKTGLGATDDRATLITMIRERMDALGTSEHTRNIVELVVAPLTRGTPALRND